jgi:hypothetical protein
MSNAQLYIGQSVVHEFRFWRDGTVLDVTGAIVSVEITEPDGTVATHALEVVDGPGGVMSVGSPTTLGQVGIRKYWITGSDIDGNLISRPASSDYVFKHY